MSKALRKYEATQEELISTFDSTCKFYVHLSGSEFLANLDKGLVDTKDDRVQRVLRRLGYVRPQHAVRTH
jgi:hypothetical protein